MQSSLIQAYFNRKTVLQLSIARELCKAAVENVKIIVKYRFCAGRAASKNICKTDYVFHGANIEQDRQSVKVAEVKRFLKDRDRFKPLRLRD